MAKNLALAGTTAKEYFKLARAFDPQFRAMTQDLTYDQLQAGYEGNPSLFTDLINKWFNVNMAIRLNKITAADFSDVVGDLGGVVQSFSTPYAAIQQRLYIHPIEALQPAWLGSDGNGLKDGDTVDPWTVMKGKMTQMFWKNNFNFQTGITLQPFERRQILASDYGMDEITAGHIRQLYVTFGTERQLAVLDCLNSMINSETFPLRSTQKIAVNSWTDTNGIDSVTTAELTNLLSLIGRITRVMRATISSGAYNARNFKTRVNPNDWVVFMRPEIMNQVQYYVEAGIFHPDKLNLPISEFDLLNFGGMIPTDSSGDVLYPVRTGKNKRLAGWATTKGAETPTVTDEADVTWEDPNEEILALIVQKGAIFTTDQNGIRVRSTGPHPSAEYENTYFNLINAGIHGDPQLGMIAVTKPAAAGSSAKAARMKAVNKAIIKEKGAVVTEEEMKKEEV